MSANAHGKKVIICIHCGYTNVPNPFHKPKRKSKAVFSSIICTSTYTNENPVHMQCNIHGWTYQHHGAWLYITICTRQEHDVCKSNDIHYMNSLRIKHHDIANVQGQPNWLKLHADYVCLFASYMNVCWLA